MVKVTFVDSLGVARVVDAEIGASLMLAGKNAGVPELAADCGGACTCSTCHVYVEPEWYDRTGARLKQEDGLLSLADQAQPNSRLSCQITISPELDGLIVHTPADEDDM